MAKKDRLIYLCRLILKNDVYAIERTGNCTQGSEN